MTLDLEHMKRVAEAAMAKTRYDERENLVIYPSVEIGAPTVLWMLEGLALLEGMAAGLEYCAAHPWAGGKTFAAVPQVGDTLAAYEAWRSHSTKQWKSGVTTNAEEK